MSNSNPFEGPAYVDLLVRMTTEREAFFPPNIGEMSYEERRAAVAEATKSWWWSTFQPGGSNHGVVGKVASYVDGDGLTHSLMFDADGNVQETVS